MCAKFVRSTVVLLGLPLSILAIQFGLAHVLMTSWALDFESRDYRFLAHKSGILPSLQAMVTLTSTASLTASVLGSLNDKSPGPHNQAIGKEASGIMTALQSWTPWSLDNIREGFVQVMRRKQEVSNGSVGGVGLVMLVVVSLAAVTHSMSCDFLG